MRIEEEEGGKVERHLPVLCRGTVEYRSHTYHSYGLAQLAWGQERCSARLVLHVEQVM